MIINKSGVENPILLDNQPNQAINSFTSWIALQNLASVKNLKVKLFAMGIGIGMGSFFAFSKSGNVTGSKTTSDSVTSPVNTVTSANDSRSQTTAETSNTGLIIGCVVAGAVIILALTALGIFCRKKIAEEAKEKEDAYKETCAQEVAALTEASRAAKASAPPSSIVGDVTTLDGAATLPANYTMHDSRAATLQSRSLKRKTGTFGAIAKTMKLDGETESTDTASAGSTGTFTAGSNTHEIPSNFLAEYRDALSKDPHLSVSMFLSKEPGYYNSAFKLIVQ